MNRSIRAAAIGAAGLGLVVAMAGPAAAAPSATYGNITINYTDAGNRVTVTGSMTGASWGELRRPDGKVVKVAAGTSRTFPNLTENARIAVRACNKPNIHEGPYCSGWSGGRS